jgi:hypothetical protein
VTGSSSSSRAATSRSDTRKYRNRPEYVDGIKFDSGLEANRYRELKLLERAGLVRDIECQPKFRLTCGGRPVLIKSQGYPNGRQATYRADFRYYDIERERQVVEDAKGYDTPGSRLRRAIVEAEFGVQVILIHAKKYRSRSKPFQNQPK